MQQAKSASLPQDAQEECSPSITRTKTALPHLRVIQSGEQVYFAGIPLYRSVPFADFAALFSTGTLPGLPVPPCKSNPYGDNRSGNDAFAVGK